MCDGFVEGRVDNENTKPALGREMNHRHAIRFKLTFYDIFAGSEWNS